jgi:hypothetical protein
MSLITSKKSVNHGVLVLLMMAISTVAWAGGPIERLDRWFVFGTNLAWFRNAYGCDIGVNHAEGGWQPSFSAEECEKVFANLEKMGCPVVRIWGFERQEGLMFTADLTSDPKFPYHEVTGLCPVFLKNCRVLMDIAAKHHVKVYWSLLNHLIREEQGGRHMRIITDPKVRASYIRNAAVPFLREFGGHPAFFAVDIINEADGAVGGADALSGGFNPLIGCSWKEMRVFIKECAAAFHEAVPGIKVTATSGWHEEKNVKAGRFSGLGLDFYDWHSYRDDPDLPHAGSLGLDKPVLIGECGPKTAKPKNGYAFQALNWKRYFEQARKGYAGILTWSYGNPGAEDNLIMVNADHSWRDGAALMHKYTRGNLFPDAGPISYTPLQTTELAAVNAAMKPVIWAARDQVLTSADSPCRAMILRVARGAWNYYPYLNPAYARLQMQRVAAEIVDIGKFVARPATAASPQLKGLKQLAEKVLENVRGVDSLKDLPALERLEEFARSSAPETGATSNPFDSGYVRPAR